MTDTHADLLRALIAAQVAVLDHSNDRSLSWTPDSLDDLDKCVAEVTKLTKQVRRESEGHTEAPKKPKMSERDAVRIVQAKVVLSAGQGTRSREEWRQVLSDAIRGLQSTDYPGTQELHNQLWKAFNEAKERE
jgi:hypothetical protein